VQYPNNDGGDVMDAVRVFGRIRRLGKVVVAAAKGMDLKE
jgi:hypothetical protein